MPYNSKDWKAAVYRGQRLTGIKQHKKEGNKFLFDVTVQQIRRKKIVTLDGTERERHQAAIRLYSEFREDLYKGYYLSPVTFDEMFNQWAALKPPTRWTRLQAAAYRNHIERHLGALNVKDVTAKDIDKVIAAVKSKAAATQKGIVSIIKSVLTLALDRKIIKQSPFEQRHGVTVKAAEQKTIVLEAAAKYRRVYESIMTVYAADPKWRAIFLFGLYGRRKSEILLLDWESISFETLTYVIRGKHSKIKQDLSFTIPRDVLQALEEIRPPKLKGLIFPNPNTGKAYTDIRSEVQKIRDHSDWQSFGFHRMRNLLSSALYGQGVEAANLSSILGHTSAETLKQYLTMQRKEACEIVENAAGKLLNKGVNYAAV